MLLDPDDCARFFAIQKSLLPFVFGRLDLGRHAPAPLHVADMTPAWRHMVHTALLERLDLLDTFVAENPDGLDERSLAVVASWRHLVAGQFIVYRTLKAHTVFLTVAEPVDAYGVLDLTEPIEQVLGRPLPCCVETILLPFGDRIVHNGVLGAYDLETGPHLRRSFDQSYRDAKADRGVITRRPGSAPAPPRPAAGRGRRPGADAAEAAWLGRWRIDRMSLWDPTAIDAVVEGFLDFEANRVGHFEFAYIVGELDVRYGERDGVPLAEFCWLGSDAALPVAGRGWALRRGDTIEGQIFRFAEPDCAFHAVRVPTRSRPPSPPRPRRR